MPLVLLCGVWRDAAALWAYPVAAGIDGYYYVIQIESLRTRGLFYYPVRTPLILYALTGVSHFTGDPVLAVKLAAVTLHALLCVGLFALILDATRSALLGALGSLIAVVSGLHFYMLAEYVNQLGAITLLVWGAWCAVRFTATRRVAWLVVAGVCLLGVLYSHRSALPLVCLIAVSAYLGYNLLTSPEGGRRRALILIALVFCAPALVAAQPFFAVPAGLRAEIMPLPSPSFLSVATEEKLALLVVAPACLLVAVRRRFVSGAASCILAAVALSSLFVTVNPFLNSARGLVSITGRLSCLAYIQVAVLVPGLIWLASLMNRKLCLLILLFAGLLLTSSARRLPAGLRPSYLAERTRLVNELPKHREALVPGSIVIAAHGDEFVVTALLGTPAQQRWPHANRQPNVYWLLHQFGARSQPSETIVLTIETDGSATALVRDDELRRQLDLMRPAEKYALMRRNPQLYEHVIRTP